VGVTPFFPLEECQCQIEDGAEKEGNQEAAGALAHPVQYETDVAGADDRPDVDCKTTVSDRDSGLVVK
jgi:hypothetical protein